MIVIKVDTLEELKAMQQMLDFANKNSVEYREFLHDENTMVEFDVDISVAIQAKEDKINVKM